MNRTTGLPWFGAALLACITPALARPDHLIQTDPRWDQTPRRTDANNAGVINPGSRLPDLLSATIGGWQSPTASTDPYSGTTDTSGHPHLFRLDVVFDGLLNPPGRLGDGNAVPYDPYRFGPSPVYGFLEFDVDADRDTGGELGPAAKTRYLANIARFGKLPVGLPGQRAAVWGTDQDRPFGESPEYRRSGTDFLLSLCGCFDPVIVSEGGNGNHIFEAGETWVVRGAFFQRAGGYRDASFCFGGSSGVPGMYDPQVNLRFSHSIQSGRTTVTLVYALDMIGAGQLAGEPAQPVNYSAADQTSIREGLQDLIDAAGSLPLFGPVWTLAHRWADRDAEEYLRPERWRMTALFGTACTEPLDSCYIWTDTGFEGFQGDVNGDGDTNGADKVAVVKQLNLLAPPPPGDRPRPIGGSFAIPGFGANFCLFDVTGNGTIDAADVGFFCIPDFDGDGRLTINDYWAFLNAFLSENPQADLNHNGFLEINDISIFSNLIAQGCP